MSRPNKKWRTSASVIIVARDKRKTNECDYNLLMLRRSEQTAFIEKQTVFPGGLLDTVADENVAWLQYFEQFGVSQALLRQLVLISDQRPSLLAPQGGGGCYDRFFKRSHIWAREITLRLTAVRECFEEVGVLLCCTHAQLGESGCHLIENFAEREYWQHRVHNNPTEFLELCKQLQVVPDLWALHEWSAWATPAVMQRGYETVFFIAFVGAEQPNLLPEPSEVEQCLWHTPSQLLQLAQLSEVFFLLPQRYELARLLGMNSYQSLLNFAHARSKLGTTLYMPVNYMCSDSLVNVLPGDDFYLPEPHLVEEFIIFEGSAAEFHARAKRQHRVELFHGFNWTCKINIEPPNGHLKPQNIAPQLQNKL